MRIVNRLPSLWLSLAASSLVLLPALSTPPKPLPSPPTRSAGAGRAAKVADPSRTVRQPIFTPSLATMYEEQAINSGRPEFVQHAIEEYKAAINADPHSAAAL